MEAMQSSSEAGQLVRSYSLELENTLLPDLPARDVRRIFIEDERQKRKREEENAQWQSYYRPWGPMDGNSDSTTNVLRVQAIHLSHSWKVFRENIPKSEQEHYEGQIPTVEGLIQMVNSVARASKINKATSKSGRFMQNFIAFSETLNSHKQMLELLPSGSEYVSLFSGTLKTIIHAVSNHEKIANGLSKALSKISIHVVACEKEVQLHKTKTIQEKISKLYAHVFLFLQDTIHWYLKSPLLRLRNSFNETFYEHFEEMIQNIQDFSEEVRREASVISMAEARRTRLIAEQSQETLLSLRIGQLDNRLAVDGVSRKQADIQHKIEVFQRQLESEREEKQKSDTHGPHWMKQFRDDLTTRLPCLIASGVRQELSRVAQSYLDQTNWNRETIEHETRHKNSIEYLDRDSIVTQSYDRGDIVFASNKLLQYFSINSLQSATTPIRGPLSLDTVASSRVAAWTTDPSLNFLCVVGQEPKGRDLKPMSVLATMCAEFASNAKLAVISYFCSLRSYDENMKEGSKEACEIISMLYALIRQLIERLPIQFSTSLNISNERLSVLDGTLASWDTSLRLLRDLIEVIPRPLYCIIDGFQVLDDPSTDNYLDELIKALRLAGKPVDQEIECLKVLLTTTRRSRALVRNLEPEEIVFADRDGAVDSPARRAGHKNFTLYNK